MNIVLPDNKGIQEAVNALICDEVVAYPTETVYGLAVNPFSERALNKLFQVKGRQENKPVLLVVGNIEQIYELVINISDKAKKCIEKFWPGPLSLLLPCKQELSKKLTAGQGKICIRWTSHPIAQKLSLEFGHAITSTSANRSGELPANTIEELPKEGINVAIKSEIQIRKEPSTVFDPDLCKILREGTIKKGELEKILEEKVYIE
ncbi:MAG TPA: L-threonylcarbamoyladenylate synthase [Candidatus Hydrogenedens sp.]|mgnify:CR=1 FL=1|nr:L-threonylcarbamoyladenylate synthase [Candidatus Hydrogenedens sp.]HOL20767.1 L-threonylcarbamoyladenylate synthase [Candidatus Hydrogenedens sp.]HPP57860.1 L-threonylcarbamoyladenylate synthase [Candidatus Hydrogenedens sp.]